MITRVVAVDAHQLLLKAIRADLESHDNIELVATSTSGEQIMPLIVEFKPDVLLLDQQIPQHHRDNATRPFRIMPTIHRLRREYPSLQIVMLSGRADPIMVSHALRAGVKGYVYKRDSDINIGVAIKLVMQDGMFLSAGAAKAYTRSTQSSLTDRQLEVLTAISHHPELSYAELADNLGMAEGTLKKHLTNSLRRLGVPSNRFAAIRICENLGLIAPGVF